MTSPSPATSAVATTPPSKEQEQRASQPPVTILSSPTAQTYAHIHPILLLSIYVLRFPALVADPVSTLLSSLVPLAALQVAYMVVCLPASAGSSSGDGGKGTPKRKGLGVGKESKSDSGSGSLGGKIIPALLSITLTLTLATPILAIILVLFGAPLTTHATHTLLCSAHMSLLSATGLIYVHGVNGDVWREVWAISRPVDTVWGGVVGTGLGAWFGAVPIPLDWDRPWQAYPITILTGAYIGYVLGSLGGRTPFLYGKRIQFTSSKEEEELVEEIDDDDDDGDEDVPAEGN